MKKSYRRYKLLATLLDARLDRARMCKTGTGRDKMRLIPMHGHEGGPRTNQFKIDLMRRRVPRTHVPTSPMAAWLMPR
jgi:hypothetical protein